MTKQIKLTQGQVALVDDEDFESLNKFKWQALWNDSTQSYYAYRAKGPWRSRITTHMAREILGLVHNDGNQVDHRNKDTLDNRRENLRVCTKSENMINRCKFKNSSSKYKGVYWNKTKKRWISQIQINGHRKSIGNFTNEIEAAKAYDAEARTHYGEFATFNFPEVS